MLGGGRGRRAARGTEANSPRPSSGAGLFRAAADTPPRRAASRRPGSSEGAAPLAGAGEAPRPVPSRGELPPAPRGGPLRPFPQPARFGPAARWRPLRRARPRGDGDDGGWRAAVGGRREGGGRGARAARGPRGRAAEGRRRRPEVWVRDSQREAAAPGRRGAAACPSLSAPGVCCKAWLIGAWRSHPGSLGDFWVTGHEALCRPRNGNSACSASVTADAAPRLAR